MTATGYSRAELLNLATCYQPAVNPISRCLWKRLCEVGLCKRGPTARGCRAGAEKQRTIRTVLGNRPNTSFEARTSENRADCQEPPTRSLTSVCYRNLIYTRPTRLYRQAKFCLLNARSVKAITVLGTRKSTAIVDYVVENDLDIIAITETWLTTDDRAAPGEITPDGYKLHHVPRTSRRGGGVAVLCKSTFQTHVSDSHPRTKSFESTNILISSGSCSVRLIVIYRPDRSKRNPHSFGDFLTEFTEMLHGLVLDRSNLLIVGDFNVHVNDTGDVEARRFLDCLTSYSMVQHVTFPTHVHGHTLDLLISRSTETIVSNVSSVYLDISDHDHIVVCDLQLQRPPPLRKHVSSRHFKGMDLKALKEDLSDSAVMGSFFESAEDALAIYTNTFTELLDKHAPSMEKMITIRPNTEWYSDEIREEKQRRRQLERQWQKSGLEVHRQMYCKQRLHVNTSLTLPSRNITPTWCVKRARTPKPSTN